MDTMIRSFAGRGTEDVFNGVDSKAARRTCPSELWKVARRKLDRVNAAVVLDDLREPPNNKLKSLGRARKGQHAIRINDQYRVCFRWATDGPEEVEVVDYHDE